MQDHSAGTASGDGQRAATTEAIIEAFGGIRPMAKKLGAPVTTIQYWKKAGRIPVVRHGDILAAAAANGITGVDAALLAKTDGDMPAGEEKPAIALPAGPVRTTPVDTTKEKDPGSPEMKTSQESANPPKPAPEKAAAEKPVEKPAPAPAKTNSSASDSAATAAAAPARGGSAFPGVVAVLALVVAVIALALPHLRGPVGAAIGSGPAEKLLGPDPSARIRALEGEVATLKASADPAALGVLSGKVSDLASSLQQIGGELKLAQESAASLPADTATRLQAMEGRLAAAERSLQEFTAALGKVDIESVTKLTATVASMQDMQGRQGKDISDLDEGMRRVSERLGVAEQQLADQLHDNLANEAVLYAALKVGQSLETADPYDKALANMAALVGEDADFTAPLETLQAYAESGVPTLDDLRDGFRATIPAIIAATAGDDRPWWQKTLDTVSGLVSIRLEPGEDHGESVRGVIARTESRLNAADLAGAVSALQELSGPPAEAAAGWLKTAQDRLAVDAAQRTMSDIALSRLTGAAD
ncbi:carph-isopro domain-containing protein [Radicibacter daui]|uniref:carph-isopro domain-containing protein n=1 Tax=Radicibacter daui TaxID=3064829 RepID=UPI004046B15C